MNSRNRRLPGQLASLPALPALVALLSAPLLGQSTWFVDAGAPGPGSGSQSDPYASIQHAIDQPATTSGDRILVLPGLYFEKVDFLAKELQIESSAGAQATRINPLADGPVVRVVGGQNSGTQLTGFTLSGGTGENFSGQTRGAVGADQLRAI